jgi:hypothetical protein
MSTFYSSKGNLVYGRPVQGKPEAKGLTPKDGEEAGLIAGVPVAKEGLLIVVAQDAIGYYGIVREQTYIPKHSYSIILQDSTTQTVVRCLAESGIKAGDLLTIASGRYIKAVAGDIVVGMAMTDASANGDDDCVVLEHNILRGMGIPVPPLPPLADR